MNDTTNTTDTRRKQSAADRIAAEFIAMLDKGVIPWHQTWTSTNRRPVNQAGRPYRGANYFMLKMFGQSPTNVYMSFNNAKKLGGKVKEGSHGVPVVFASRYDPATHTTDRTPDADDNADTEPQTVNKGYFFWKGYTVFGVNQIDGLPDRFYQVEAATTPDPIAAADEVIGNFEGAPEIDADGSDPCYIPAIDTVKLPGPDRFKSIEAFYAALFHELSHSTGHESRLHRKIKSHDTDPDSYSHEELIAELSAAILLDHCGINAADIAENQAAYCANWAKALKEQPGRAIITAAAQASRAAEWILGLRRE